jgi:hypothetical protein
MRIVQAFFRRLAGLPQEQQIITRVIERYAPGASMVTTVAPRITSYSEADERLWIYIRSCLTEISGLGDVKYLPVTNELKIEAVHLFAQECSGMDTSLSPEAVGKYMTERTLRNVPTNTLKLWWHSHADGDVYWSQHQDIPTIEALLEFGFTYLLSIVGNHRGEYLCRLDIAKPFRITFDNLPIRLIHPENAELQASIAAEVAEKVTTFAFPEEETWTLPGKLASSTPRS